MTCCLCVLHLFKWFYHHVWHNWKSILQSSDALQVTTLCEKEYVWDYTQRDAAKSQVWLFGKADQTGVGSENDMDEDMDIRVRQEYFSDKSRKEDLADESLGNERNECSGGEVEEYKSTKSGVQTQSQIWQREGNCSNAMMITVIKIKSGMLQVQKCEMTT